MVLRYAIFRKTKFLAIFTIPILVCIVIVASTYAFSQPNLPNNELILGMRTIAPPVARFCYDFRDTLQEKLNDRGQAIHIKSVPILNQYKGSFYSRYIGLLKNSFDLAHIDLECGTNSTSSGQLINPNSQTYFSEEITFSKPFHKTAIKLLLKKDLARRLSNSSSSNFEEEIGSLKIGVLSDTSTLRQFEENEALYQNIPIEPIVDSTNPSKGINSLERVLRALDNNGNLDNDLQIDAFASDAIILQSLLKEGVEGSGKKGELAYIEKRPGYELQNYTIFPSGEFTSPIESPSPADGNTYLLPELKEENYAIVIKKGTSYETWLSEIISDSLDDLSIPESKLKKAQDILWSYEIGTPSNPPINKQFNSNIYNVI